MSKAFLQKVVRNLAESVCFLLFLCYSTAAMALDAAVGVVEKPGAVIPLDITFRDESGRPLRLGDLITGPTIIMPVYFRCSNVCSVQQLRMATVLQSLQQVPVRDYRVISVSFDEEETPEMAARSRHSYLSAMKKPFPEDGWRFLTGDRDSIHRLTDAVGYGFQRQRQEFAHPVASIVVSADGRIVRYLYGLSLLPKDLALAITQAGSGVAGASIRTLMDYCFSYDPAGNGYVFNLLKVSATVVILCAGSFLVFLFLGGRKRRCSIPEKQ